MTRGKPRGTAFIWLLPTLGLLLTVLWTGSAAALAGLAALIVFLLTAGVLSAVQARRLTLRLTLPPSAAKNDEIHGTLTLAGSTFFPIGCVDCTLELINELTGERDTLRLTAAPGRTAFSFRALHCGQIRVRLRRAVLTGLTGLCRSRVKTDAAAQLTVLPDTFAAEVFLQIDPSQSEDSDDAPERRGSDLSEPYALREYQPGDKLNRLHWKLTGKLDRLIVREGSEPVSRSLLILWDKGGSAEALDAQAEALFSVCQALAQEGLRFTLGWTAADGLRFAEAASETPFETLALTLRDAPPQEDMLAAALAAQGELRFGKAVCLCAAISPALEELCGANTTVLLCGTETEEAFLPVVSFSPKDYEAALRHLEL